MRLLRVYEKALGLLSPHYQDILSLVEDSGSEGIMVDNLVLNETMEENMTFVCPVCGRLLHEKNLPDMESIIYDNLYDQGGVRIGSPKVRLYCDFEHCYDEEGFTMENPHNLVGAVDAEFDQAGDCTTFVLVEIHPAKEREVE